MNERERHLTAVKEVVTHANDWVISVDSSTHPSQSQFNQIEDAEPLFRHNVPHSPVHARAGANFIKHAVPRPKFCTEARDSVLKPAHTMGGAPKPDPRDRLGFLAQPLRPLRRVIFYRIQLVLKI